MSLKPNNDPAAPHPRTQGCRRPASGAARRRRSAPSLVAGLRTLLAACLALSTPASAGYVASVLVSGLDNPRGLAFGPAGALYITQAGAPVATGPSTTIRGDTFILGQTGSVIRYQDGAQQSVLTGLPSLSSATTGETSGAQGIAFGASGKGYVAIGLGANPNVRSTDLAPGGVNLGQIVTFGGGTGMNLADVAGFEAAYNPGGGPLDSNPFHLAATANGLLVTDAGGNSLLGVGYDGAISSLATFPARALGGPRPTESVPTGVTVGPDGATYVGELTGFPFVQGSAQIYRVAPGRGVPSVYLTGFTNISDLAFGGDGSLYVLELDANGLLAPGTDGALIRVAPDGTRTTVLSAGLVAPTGLAVGPDGAFYISNYGSSAGDGQVLRIAADVPEPASLGLLAAGLASLSVARRRLRSGVSRNTTAREAA